MILLTILMLALLIATLFVIAVLGVGGALTIIVFGDVIVCIIAIVYILKHLLFRK